MTLVLVSLIFLLGRISRPAIALFVYDSLLLQYLYLTDILGYWGGGGVTTNVFNSEIVLEHASLIDKNYHINIYC